jgi:hypothetical protein
MRRRIAPDSAPQHFFALQYANDQTNGDLKMWRIDAQMGAARKTGVFGC